MEKHNETGLWDAVAFYVVLACCGGLITYGLLHRTESVHYRAPADAATPRPAHRAP